VPGAGSYALRRDESLRRLIGLAARAVGMGGACVSLPNGSSTHEPISTPGYDVATGQLVAGLDAEVALRGRPLAVPDLAARSSPESSSSNSTTGSYLGVPLLSSRNLVTGVLHALDRAPRPRIDEQVNMLTAYGRAISDHIEQRSHPPGDQVDDEEVADVAQALRAGNIEPWYQPIVDLNTGRLTGLEALARRTYPDGRVEGPDAFVPIAEQSDLIVDLDLAVLRLALVDLKRWQCLSPGIYLNVNMSGRHLDRDGWAASLLDLVTSADVSPTTVHLEITETARPVDLASAGARMELARSLGFPLWLDDFGSGWSGFRDLLYLPVHGIKIDQFFAAGLGTRVGDVLVKALATAAIELGLKVIIEGIETRDQVAVAQELGCHYGQGFFWSAPVPASSVDQVLSFADGEFPQH